MGNGPHFQSHEGINHQSKQISPSQRLLLHKPAVVLRASAGQNVGVGMGRKLRGHRGAERVVDDVMATRLLSRLGHTLQGGWDGGRDSRQNSHDNDIGDTNAQDDLADQVQKNQQLQVRVSSSHQPDQVQILSVQQAGIPALWETVSIMSALLSCCED